MWFEIAELINTLDASCENLQTLPLHEVEQLQRRSTRFLFPDFPFLYRGDAGIEMRSKHSLACPRSETQPLDLSWPIASQRWQSQGIEPSHGLSIDCSQVIEAAGGSEDILA